VPRLFELRVNGQAHRVRVEPGTPLLYVLRNDVGLSGPKFGCGQGQCGACSVLVDGIERLACVYPVSAASKGHVTTVEGLGTAERPSPLQQAFIDEQAGQCGYCSSGMIMAAQALLGRNPKPTEADVKTALDGHLCRCGAHNRIVRAVLRASQASSS
jgi:nicotinate dehydrogenase subunit A